jgi:hypothetical protein
MGGAFTAVADDATAAWWNPAGLATGAYFSMIVERSRIATDEPVVNDPFESRTGGFAVAFPALAISYYRIRVNELAALPSIDLEAPDRQEEEAGEPVIRGAAISRYGVTAGQSLTDGLVVAATLKLLRGGQIQLSSNGGLDAADALDVPLSTKVDVDFGVMATLGRIRLGGTVRNVTEPDFGGEAGDLRLDRQVRVGGAFVGPDAGLPLTVAVDTDLTETTTALGEVRHASAGVEGWVWERRLGLRGGVSMNTVGPGGEAFSGGASLLFRAGFRIEGAITRGSDKSREGWSLGSSVTF